MRRQRIEEVENRLMLGITKVKIRTGKWEEYLLVGFSSCEWQGGRGNCKTCPGQLVLRGHRDTCWKTGSGLLPPGMYIDVVPHEHLLEEDLFEI